MQYKNYIKFLNSLEQLIRAGVDISNALKIITTNSKNKKIKLKIYSINKEISKGFTLSYAIQKHICSKINQSNIIKIGEDSGNLADILKFISYKEEKLIEVKNKILKSSIYPAIVLATTIFTLTIITSKIIPEFILLFDEFKAPIPKQITFILKCTATIKIFFVIFFYILLFSLLFYFISSNKTKNTFKYSIQKYFLNIPIISTIANKYILYNFFFNLGISLRSGIPIASAISICANTTNILSYRYEFLKIKESLINGKSLSSSTQKSYLIPDFCKKLINIGETTGNIDKIILEIAAIFERDIVNFLDKFIIMLEPCLILIVGLLVGYIVISLYAPLINIGTIL